MAPCRRPLALLVVASAVLLAGCTSDPPDDARGRPTSSTASPSAAAITATDLPGTTVRLTDAGQGFDYQLSIIGWSALGDQVPAAMVELGYAASRRLWDEGLATTLDAARFDDVSLITLAAAARTDELSGRTFLTDDQRRSLTDYIDQVIAGRLPADPQRGVLAPTAVAAGRLRQMARSLDHRTKQVEQFVRTTQARLADAEVTCTAEGWRSGVSSANIVSRLDAGLDLGCTSPQVVDLWRGLVQEALDGDADPGKGIDRVQSITVAASVLASSPDLFTPPDRALLQRAVDATRAALGDEPFDWLYLFAAFAERPGVAAMLPPSPASRAIDVFFASHGGAPALEVTR